MSEATGGGSRREIEQRLIQRNLEDDSFRQALLADPKVAIEQEVGTELWQSPTHKLTRSSGHSRGRRCAPGKCPMDKPNVASLRARREGVNRGRWWGVGSAIFPAHPAVPPHRDLPAKDRNDLAGGPFQPFRWGHEFLFAESVERLIAWKAGRLGHEGMRCWLASRAEAGALELDSASFNHYFMDILVELHPAARFVYTRRDAVSWADSF